MIFFPDNNPAIVGGKKKIIISMLLETIEEHFILIPLGLILEHKFVSEKREKNMKTICM